MGVDGLVSYLIALLGVSLSEILNTTMADFYMYTDAIQIYNEISLQDAKRSAYANASAFNKPKNLQKMFDRQLDDDIIKEKQEADLKAEKELYGNRG